MKKAMFIVAFLAIEVLAFTSWITIFPYGGEAFHIVEFHATVYRVPANLNEVELIPNHGFLPPGSIELDSVYAGIEVGISRAPDRLMTPEMVSDIIKGLKHEALKKTGNAVIITRKFAEAKKPPSFLEGGFRKTAITEQTPSSHLNEASGTSYPSLLKWIIIFAIAYGALLGLGLLLKRRG